MQVKQIFEALSKRIKKVGVEKTLHAHQRVSRVGFNYLSFLTRTSKRSLESDIIDKDIALSIPAVDENCNAGLGGGRRKGDCQLCIAATTGPGGSSALYADVGKRAINESRKCVCVICLHRNRLIALASG